MRYKKHMIILLAAIFLFAMATASATDLNDTAVAVDDGQLTDEIIQASENQENTIQASNNDEVNLSEDDSGKHAIGNDKKMGKTVTNHTFDAIDSAIESDCTIYLKPGTYTGDNSISIYQKSNIKIIGNSTILYAQGQRQIFYIEQSNNITIQNIIFKNGYTGNDGGAIGVYNSCRDCSISNCTFINNTARGRGGAISWSTLCDNGRVSNCTFINNTAKENGGAIRWYNSNDGRVNNCTFINNTAEGEGDAIYANGCDLNADYNWFGNTADNYNDPLPITWYVKCDYRLFLNATANPDTITGKDTSNVTFKLYQYGSDVISDYDNAPFKNLDLTITATKGNVKGTAKLGEPIQFTPTRGGTASVTATVEDVRQTAEINVKGDFDLLQDLVNNESLSVINLERNYTYNNYDTITDGVRITRPITVNGNGFTIDAKDKSRIFYIEADNVVIENLTLKNGKAYGSGGAIYFSNSGSVENCNFTGNKATGTNSWGGAVYFDSDGDVRNCNFTNNSASSGGGGAIYFNNEGNVTNCNFTNNKAIGSYGGGAIWMYSGSVENCNFTKNTATNGNGGAIWMYSGSVENCNFTDNQASSLNGGAVYFNSIGNVTNCNFTGNTAKGYGGAVFFVNNGNVTNCNFTNNKATGSNSWGGAILFASIGNVTNCNFTGNNATTGSAIYFYSTSAAKTVSNSRFLNNRANAESLVVTKNDNNITITFTGNDNLLNAIYSNGDVTFTNVTYWSANVIANTDSSATIPSRSNKEAGQNITIEIYDSNNKLVENVTLVTNDNGQVKYDFIKLSNGNYTYKAYHPEDSYYTYTNITGNFTLNSGLGDFNRLQSYINGSDASSVLTLCQDYTFTIGKDENLTGGIVIDKPLTINGNGYTINALQKARIFNVTAADVVLENINFTNANSNDDGGAIFFEYSGTVKNCNFTNNTATNNGGAICMGSGNVENCNFTNNKATGSNSWGGAVYFNSNGNVTNCNFTNNTATNGDGGAIWMYSGSVENCNFINNTATNGGGGAVFFLWDGTVTNCNFTNNSARYGGAIEFDGTGTVTNCNFTGNNAITGSAIYFYSNSATKTVSNSRFLNNRANAEDLQVTKNDNNITIVFTGNDNLLNAIYSRNDAEVTFTNVTYWSANGIATTESSAIKPPRSNKEAGQNITVGVVVNGELVLSGVYLTNENGMIVLDIIAGDNYYITARHDTDSYYTEAEKTNSTMKFNVNVTSQTTNNKTVNITAKSNMLNEVMPGKLLFILPNGTEINATYAGNGTWWAVHTFDDYSEYKINASYVGLDNVTVNNATISINKVNSTITLEDVVMNYGDSINVTVKTEGAIGITAKINDNPVSVVNNYTIPISSLNAGNYTLTVTTIPDEDHNSINKTVNLTVNKIDSVISCSDEYNLTYANHVQYISGTATGVQNIKIDGSCVWEVGFRQDGEFEIGILGDANRYNVTVTTIPDDNHNSVTKRIKVSIKPIESHIDVNDVVLNYGDSYNVSVTTEGATGVTAKIDGSDVSVLNNFTIPISGLNAGNHTLTVTTIPDKNHYSTDKKVKITVNKVNSTLTVDDVVLDYGDSVNVTVTAESATGITAKIDDNPVNVVNNYTIPISSLNAGNHTLTVTTIADINHNNVTKTAKITVNKVNSTLTVEDIEFNYNRNGSTAVSYTGATGVNASVIDQPKAVVNVDENKITVSGLDAGNYTLTVTTIADDNHNTVNKTIKVTVNPASSGLEVNGTDIFFGNDAILNYTAVNATGINMSISDWRGNALKEGVDYNITITDSQIIIRFFDDGTYTVNVTALTDDNHVPTSRNVTVHVNPICDLEVILTPMNLTANYGDTITWNATIISHGPSYPFNVNLYAYAQEGLIFKNAYSDSNYYHLSIPFTLYPNIPLYVFLKTLVNASNVNLTLNVSVRDEYFPDPNPDNNNASATVEIEYVKADLNITAPSQITVGDSASVEVALPEDATGNITVKVDGKEITTVSLINGSANVELSDLNAGNHTVEIIYSGDEKYSSANETKEITVSKQDTTAEVTIPANITVGDDANVNVKLPGDATGNVTLKLDGETVDTVPVTNGTANITIPSLTSGNHTVEITYSGDDKYNPSNKTVTVSVDKEKTQLTAKDVTATYKVKKYLKITLKDSQGNPLANSTVTVELSTAKNYTTDENGQVKVKVSSLVPKTYTAKIAFKGDDNYVGSNITAKVTVKKATAKITAKAKTFKTTTKTKKYTVMLKANGKALKNKWVYLKVNGKKYKAKTNSKGKATFKITQLNKAGKYKATVTFKGNDYYKKATKKATIKVKSVWKTVQKGSKNSAIVKKIQRALKNHGYYLEYNGRYLMVDGIFWDYTEMAVKEFQKDKTLKVTGKVDEKTAKKLGII